MKSSRRSIVEAIHVRTSAIDDPSLLAKEIAAYLLNEGRTDELEPILRDLITHRMKQGVVEATVVSAHELEAAVIADIKEILSEQFGQVDTIKLNSKINPDLVGGVRVVLPNQQLDLSVRSRLSHFKSSITAGEI